MVDKYRPKLRIAPSDMANRGRSECVGGRVGMMEWGRLTKFVGLRLHIKPKNKAKPSSSDSKRTPSPGVGRHLMLASVRFCT